MMSDNFKIAFQANGQALTAAGTAIGTAATNFVDTKGFRQATFVVSTEQTETGTWSVLNIAHSDTSNDSAAATARVSLVGGTATSTAAGFVIASSPTAGTWSTMIKVDLNGLKRYVKVNAVPSVAQTASVVCILTEPEIGIDSATEAGVTKLVAG
jgi:hypothetical protein